MSYDMSVEHTAQGCLIPSDEEHLHLSDGLQEQNRSLLGDHTAIKGWMLSRAFYFKETTSSQSKLQDIRTRAKYTL
jgi:hypothetical protein